MRLGSVMNREKGFCFTKQDIGSCITIQKNLWPIGLSFNSLLHKFGCPQYEKMS